MTTKEKILAASLTLFNEQGTDVVTVRHIAQAMGMTDALIGHWRRKQAKVQVLQRETATRSVGMAAFTRTFRFNL